MALQLESNRSIINELLTGIATQHSTSCASYPWSTISDKLDTIFTNSETIENSGLGILNEDIGSVIDSTKNYGVPCGITSVLGNTNIDEIFTSKWELFNKISEGGIFNYSIAILEQTTGLSCADLESYVDLCISDLVANITFLSNVSSKLSFFTDLNDEIMGMIGVVGTFLSCTDAQFQAVGSGSSWISEINSDYKDGLDVVLDAKATGGTAADIYNNSIIGINDKKGWDGSLETLNSDFNNLLSTFPD